MAPRCRYFGECGGCTTQHLPYELQLANKKKYLEHRFGMTVAVFPSQPYGYRNRMDFSMAAGPALRKMGRYDRTVHIERCEICSETINTLLSEVRTLSALTNCTYTVIRASRKGDSSTVSFVFTPSAADVTVLRTFARESTARNVVVADVQSDDSVSLDCYALKGDVYLQEEILDKTLQYHSQGFFQNNPLMAEQMVGYVKENLKVYSTVSDTVLDLYGGVGTFGICLADLFKQVVIVESAQECIECAQHNGAINHMTNVRALCMDADTINRLALSHPIVITDPPRSGMSAKALERMIALQAPCIAYVSCNPQQFAKEFRLLSKRYELVSLALFDLFPQTNHKEIIVLLKKK